MTDRTTLVFTFGSDVSGVLSMAAAAGLAGSKIPVRWGEHQAKGTIERVDVTGQGIRVTMTIDREPGLGEAPPCSAGFSVPEATGE